MVLVAERPESVNMLVLGMLVEFKAIFAGLNEQVPDPQARAMVSVKVPAGNRDVIDMVKVVVVVPMGSDCVR